MKREEKGLPSPDPDLQENYGNQVFKVSHPKPICPRCGKKTVTFYIRGNKREYLPMGYYCNQCDETVKRIPTAPPKIYRMDIWEYLNSATDKFDVILADPPWTYETETIRKSDRISSHYMQMSTIEICNLPIQSIAEKNAVLFLWATSPKLDEAITVLKSWGFKYKTNYAWNKKLMGLGYLVRQQHETLLIGIKGRVANPGLKFRSMIDERRRDHSRKPVKSYEIIQAMYPEANKIELFARWVYPGWVGVGNEAEPKPDHEVHAKNQKKCIQKFEVKVI